MSSHLTEVTVVLLKGMILDFCPILSFTFFQTQTWHFFNLTIIAACRMSSAWMSSTVVTGIRRNLPKVLPMIPRLWSPSRSFASPRIMSSMLPSKREKKVVLPPPICSHVLINFRMVIWFHMDLSNLNHQLYSNQLSPAWVKMTKITFPPITLKPRLWSARCYALHRCHSTGWLDY